MNAWENVLVVLIPFAVLVAVSVWVASLFSVLAERLAELVL